LVRETISVDAEVVKIFSSAPAASNLFKWQACGYFVVKGEEPIPLIAEDGLIQSWDRFSARVRDDFGQC
jgi:hypothetical protein